MHGLSASLPAVHQVYLWANVVPQGATRHSACPTLRHSESGPLGLSVQMWGRRVCQCSDCVHHLSHTPPVSVPPQPQESSPPRCPPLPLLPVWMCLFSICLVSVPLAVRFSVSSCCARRRSVSTCAAILVLPPFCIFNILTGIPTQIHQFIRYLLYFLCH